jgi:ferredoxin-type protein NapH
MEFTDRVPREGRQKLRKLILLLSFTVFPITVVFLAPAPPIMSLKEGTVNLSVTVLAAIVLSGFPLRRAFCGWICPGAGCQLVAKAINDRPIESRKVNWLRILLVGAWAIMVAGTVVVRGVARVELGSPGGGRFAASEIRYFLPYIPVVTFMFGFVFVFGRRGFCHRGCWISPIISASTQVSRMLRVPGLHVEVRDAGACSKCGTCTKVCPMSIDVLTVVRSRRTLPNSCVQCGACVDGCPRKVLRFRFWSEPIQASRRSLEHGRLWALLTRVKEKENP